MIYLDFYNKLDSLQDKEYIETFLVYNLSLVIAGICNLLLTDKKSILG